MFVKTQDMDRSVVTVKTYSKISYQKKITPRKLEKIKIFPTIFIFTIIFCNSRYLKDECLWEKRFHFISNS